MKVLYVTYGLPYPPHSGARLHDYQLLRHVAREAEVYHCSLATGPEEMEHVPALARICRKVEAVEGWRPAWRQAVAAVRGVWAGRPLAMTPFFFPELADRMATLVREEKIDIVQVEHSILAGYRDAIPPGHPCRTVLSFHNIASRQYRLMAETARFNPVARGKAWLMSGWEARWAARFDHCLTVSPFDRNLLLAEAPALPVTVIDNGVDVDACQPLAETAAGNDLLFVGVMGYPPNADGARWFCRVILPLLRREVPDVRLWLVGHAPPPAVRRLHDGRHVIVTGSVPDVRPFYQRARVCVVPLRAGSGTRLKVLEAFAFGRPVVSTTLGCEGIAARPGTHLELADTARAFAGGVVRLLQDRARRECLARQARQLVAQCYAWPTIAARLLAVYRRLLHTSARHVGDAA